MINCQQDDVQLADKYSKYKDIFIKLPVKYDVMLDARHGRTNKVKQRIELHGNAAKSVHKAFCSPILKTREIEKVKIDRMRDKN